MNTIFLGLHPTNLGTETKEMTNPFTGETLVAHVGDAASESEFNAGVTLLDAVGASSVDPDGFRAIQLPGGCMVSVNFGHKGSAINIEGGFALDAFRLVFDLALAGRMLVTSTIEPDVVAVLPGHRHAGVEERWPNAVDVDSAESLMEWVQKEIDNGRIA